MKGRLPVEVDQAMNLLPLERNCDVLVGLKNLKRKFHIHNARDSGHKALRKRIGGLTVCEILKFLCRSPRLIGYRATVHDSFASRHPQFRGMILQIVRRPVANLPNSLQIRFAIPCPRQSLRGHRQYREQDKDHGPEKHMYLLD
jgi:hypothetical protein